MIFLKLLIEKQIPVGSWFVLEKQKLIILFITENIFQGHRSRELWD